MDEKENILWINPEENKPLGILWSKNWKPNEEVKDEGEDLGENGKFMPKKHELTFNYFNKEIKIIQNAKECCGGYLWRAETVTLQYLENMNVFPEGHWKDKYVIEVGSGTGLIGLFLVHVGAYVALTDQNSMLPLIQQNVSINNLPENRVNVSELFWGVTDCTLFTKNSVDYIIACDCIYLEIAFDPLVKTLWDLSNCNTIIIIGYQKRRKADKRFWKLAQKKFEIKRIPNLVYSKSKSEPVQIFHLKKKSISTLQS